MCELKEHSTFERHKLFTLGLKCGAAELRRCKKEHEDFKPSLPPRVRCQFKERRLFSFSSFLFSLFTLCTFAVFLLELRKEGNALFFYASLSALVLSYLGRAFCIYGLRKDMKEGRTTGFLMGAAAYLFDPKCGQYLLRPHLRDKQLQSSKYWDGVQGKEQAKMTDPVVTAAIQDRLLIKSELFGGLWAFH